VQEQGQAAPQCGQPVSVDVQGGQTGPMVMIQEQPATFSPGIATIGKLARPVHGSLRCGGSGLALTADGCSYVTLIMPASPSMLPLWQLQLLEA
jgi:hypothetical protein